MDIYCPQCGEMWDADEVHEQAESFATDFYTMWHAFQRKGCGAFNARHTMPPNQDVARFARIVYDMLGDDLDGCVTELEDALTG